MRQKQITLAQFINKEPPVSEHIHGARLNTATQILVCVYFICVRVIPVGFNRA